MSSSDENSSGDETIQTKPTYRQKLKAEVIKKQRNDQKVINKMLNDDIKFTETCEDLKKIGMCQNEFCLYQHHPKQLICKYICQG